MGGPVNPIDGHPLWGWELALWEELEQLDPTERIIRYGETITYMTRELLAKLGDRRRQLIIEELAKPEMDATKLAESIGARRTAINRLANEGRARLREQQRG